MPRDGILSGVRILDLTWGLAGPVAGRLLAEVGADVIKVEPPGGDPVRRYAAFATWNRSKRSLELDLEEEPDRIELERLLASADVLLHGLRPSRAQRLGLDDDSLARRFPDLIACSLLGYPPEHADAERPGYDILVQARLGLMDEQQGHREGPIFLRFPVPSWGAVYLAAAGILARLLLRERTGVVGPVHTSLLQGALVTLTMHWARARSPSPAFRFGLPKSMIPSLFPCSDGRWIHVMAAPYHVELMERTLAELPSEEIERTRAARGGQPGYFGDDARMETALRTRPSREWLEAFWAADVPVLPAQSLGEILRDEQARKNGYVVEVHDPEWGRTLQAGSPLHVTPLSRVRSAAPRLDEHAAEIRAEPPRLHSADPCPRTASSPAGPPLRGVRVLDLGCFLAGPFAAMLMADLGADVIKLEPRTGDRMRGVERVFAGCQRGKRAIAVDLKHPEAREVIEALVRWADVVHHNLRYPAARKLGIDYETLRPLNPRLIYCHTSAYGPRGPRADWPGYDQLFQAYSGWEVEGGGEGNPPMWHRMGMMDHQNALASLVATLLALLHRERTGEGQFVSASILGASVLTASETLVLCDADGALAPYPRLDRLQTGVTPGYRIYETRDGWIAVAALEAAALRALREVLGVEKDTELPGAFEARTTSELADALEAGGVAAEPVRLDQGPHFFDDFAHRAAGLTVNYAHPRWGRLEQIGALWSFGDRTLRLDRPPPELGEHSREILDELGFDAATIARLAESGAVLLGETRTHLEEGPGTRGPDPFTR
ncbi:MAG: CoA transferase [Myxococcota bacterium]